MGRIGTLWRRVASAVVILVAAGALLFLLPINPYTVTAAAGRVRPGMTQDEAVTAVLQCETIRVDTYYYRGKTKAGLAFSGTLCFDLPPAPDVAWAVLEVPDDYGNTLFIDLGEGGIVSAIRLDTPGSLGAWQFALRRLVCR